MSTSPSELVVSIACGIRAEFVADVAARFPFAAICELRGAPHERCAEVFQWTNVTLDASIPCYPAGTYAAVDHNAGSTALVSYLGPLAADRRANSAAVVMTGLTESAVEETLRWTSPIVTFVRLMTADTEIGGQRVRAGEKVVLWYPSGVRDEDVFERPDEVDVNCEPHEQLAFGGSGEHFYLSANLARLEMRCLFVHVLDRLSETELDGEDERLRSGFVGGITRPSISVGAARSGSVQPSRSQTTRRSSGNNPSISARWMCSLTQALFG